MPELNSGNKLIGYNVFDDSNTDRNMPVLQLEPGDLEGFKANFSNYIAGARMYYSAGEPSQGMKEVSAGLAMQNYSYAAGGVKKEWKGALHDPVWWAGALLSTANLGVKLFEVGDYQYYSKQVPEDIHPGQQGKHIEGHNNYQVGKSILTANPDQLLQQFHDGNTTILRQTNANKIIVDFNKPIGYYVSPGSDPVPTTRGAINFGKSGAHIVPTAPK